MNWKIFLLVGLGLVGALFVGIILFVVPAFPFNTLFNLSHSKQASGSVYDCETKLPVVDATVMVVGTGWGWRNSNLVWDKSYFVSTTSQLDGSFKLDYKIGTKLSAERDGYLKAIKYFSESRDVAIGLVKKNDSNKAELNTYDCKLLSECMKTEIIDGVETSWNACSNPELNKDL